MSGESSIEQIILGLESRRIAAMVGKDLEALAPILADELTYSHSSGRTDTKASFLELVRSGHYVDVSFPRREVVPCGTAAVVRGQAQMRVHHEGAELSYPILFLETYVLRNGWWQLLAWQATRAKE